MERSGQLVSLRLSIAGKFAGHRYKFYSNRTDNNKQFHDAALLTNKIMRVER